MVDFIHGNKRKSELSKSILDNDDWHIAIVCVVYIYSPIVWFECKGSSARVAILRLSWIFSSFPV